LVDGLLKELVLWILEHQTNLEAHRPGVGFGAPDILSIEENLARARLKQAVQMLNQGGFS